MILSPLIDANSIEILFAGDFIPPAHGGPIFSESLLKVLKNKDFSVVNLECPLTTANHKIFKIGNNFKTLPNSIRHITSGGFNAVSLSNNHIRDFHDQGVLDTINVCQKHKILTVGAGPNIQSASTPLTIKLKGKSIAFLNYSEKEFNAATPDRAGANPFDLIEAFYQIRSEKAHNDYVVVLYHGGCEYHYLPMPEIIRRFKFLVDAGADCIVSHHTHRLSGVIKYNQRPLFFGLGNFLTPTKTKANDSWLTGVLVKIVINYNAIRHELIPIKMSKDFSFVDDIKAEERQNVIKFIDDLSEKINNTEFLHNYWNKACLTYTNSLTNVLSSDSLLEYRFRKRIPAILKRGLPRYRLLNVLNLIRCDAHRDMAIRIMEGKYQKLKGK
jgi:poly-gamma-glutamate synthesis protein (capsule biosynthesis protein)